MRIRRAGMSIRPSMRNLGGASAHADQVRRLAERDAARQQPEVVEPTARDRRRGGVVQVDVPPIGQDADQIDDPTA
jgi:hypothetical protein